jgi:putative copper resistance protein D
MDDATLDALRLVACAIVDAGGALAIGALAVALLLARGDSPGRAAARRTALRALSAGAALALVADVALLWIEAMSMAEVGPAAALPEMRGIALDTHFGRAWLAGFVSLVLLLVARAGVRRGLADLRAAAVFACLTFALARAGTSHVGADGFGVATLVMAVHLLATGTWAGGVAVAACVMRRGAPDAAWVRALSRLATIALALAAATGVAVGLVETQGSLAPLASSRWGFVLDAKLALVAAAVALGGFNRFVAMPPLLAALDGGADDGRARRRFARVLAVEAFVLLAVVLVAAVLANGEPPAVKV